MEELKDIIAANLAECRKRKGLTQLDVANLLNYSDKAVSKWERAESLPDIIILKKLADVYGLTVDDLLKTELPPVQKKSRIIRLLRKHKLIIPLLCAGLVWFIATVAFVFFIIFDAPFKHWLAFIYAIPLSLIVLLVFNSIWGNKILSAVIVSALVWSIPFCITLSIYYENIWYIFLIPIPLQIITVLWYIMRVKRSRKEG